MNTLDNTNRIYSSWQENFNLALSLYNSSSELNNDEYITELITTAHNQGLNYNRSPDQFIVSSKVLAKLHFKYKRYILAENNLLLLRELNKDDIEDNSWIAFYSVITYYKTGISTIINNPSTVFEEIINLPDSHPQDLKQKNAVILDFIDDIKDYRLAHPEYDYSGFDKKYRAWKYYDFKSLHLPKYIEISTVEELETQNPYDIIASLEKEIEELKIQLEEYKNATPIQAVPVNPINIEIDTYIKPRKLLIISDKHLQRNIVMGICSNYGFDKKDINYFDEYGKLPFSFEKIRYNSPYDTIIFGSIPHSMTGKGNYSSIIEMLKNEEGYPHIEECKTNSGELKMTKESLKRALERTNNYLDAIQ